MDNLRPLVGQAVGKGFHTDVDTRQWSLQHVEVNLLQHRFGRGPESSLDCLQHSTYVASCRIIAGFDPGARVFESFDLTLQPLRVSIRAADNRDHFQVSAGIPGRPDARGNRWSQLARRIGMCAVTQHDIQQNHGNFRVSGFFLEQADPEIIVQHGMQPPHSEFVLAQVDDRVSLADQ